MKPIRLNTFAALTALAALLIPSPLLAADQVITGTISGTQTYSSTEGIVFDHVVLNSDAQVTATANYEVHLAPGTRLADGARLSISIPDNDGLSNRCEMTYFGDLTHDPDDDDDTDGLTNIQECTLGSNPNQNSNNDADGDGMPDGWETSYGLNPGTDDASLDGDGDGLTNLAEFQAGTNPVDSDTDDDTMPDGWEVQYGLNPVIVDNGGDLDGDGLPNGDEYTSGSNPVDPQSAVRRITYSYNALSELTTVNYYGQTFVTHVYDNAGNLTKSITLSNFANNGAPSALSYSFPENGSSGNNTRITLSWNAATDPNASDTVFYDLYIGTTPAPALAYSSLQSTGHTLSLSTNTTYYWKIIAKDNHGGETSGPVWSFSTGSGQQITVDFAASVTRTPGPVAIYFTDLTNAENPIVSWQWDFNNDGVIDSTNRAPYYYYFPAATPAVYSVRLTVSDQYGNTGTILKPGFITIDTDEDGDSVIDVYDNCPNLSNQEQTDGDADGIGDACDNCPNDPTNDPDHDNNCYSDDNCPWQYNPDQTDADGNGIGDVCEGDFDSDGIADAEDNCPYFNNPDQHDLDGDGLGDACTHYHCVSNSSELQAALLAAQHNFMNDVVMLRQGIYTVTDNNNARFSFEDDEKNLLAIKGGYTEGCGGRVLNYTNTIIDGESTDIGALALVNNKWIPNDERFESFLLEGLTIKNGGRWPEVDIQVESGGLHIAQCHIMSDHSFGYINGGLDVSGNGPGALVIENSAITGNPGGQHAGIYIRGYRADILLLNNRIANASFKMAAGGGADIATSLRSITAIGNVFVNNFGMTGGGIYASAPQGSITLKNNILSGNHADEGGGLYLSSGTVNALNNTITGNSTSWGNGGGLYLYLEPSNMVNLYNNIIWGNSAPPDIDGADAYYYSFEAAITANAFYNNFDPVRFSGLQHFSAVNNTNLVPDFEDVVNGDYHLNSSSPMKNAGDNSAPGLPSLDIDGDPRIVGGRVDIGADEINE